MEKERRYKSCWNYFHPPPRLNFSTLTDYIPKTKEQRRAKQYCETYNIGDIRAGKGMIMQGLYGSGKTHLAIATINNLMESDITSFGCTAYQIEEVSLYDHEINDYPGIHCSFFNVVDLLNRLKPKNSHYSKHYGDWLLRRAKYDGIVVLDDVGYKRVTEWVEETLYSIVNTRYEKELATIFTSNCSDEQLRDKLGGRILSRVFGMAEKVIVTGPDGRRV